MTRLSHTLPPGLQAAMERLEASIRARGPMVVACSGGVDSGLLASYRRLLAEMEDIDDARRPG